MGELRVRCLDSDGAVMHQLRCVSTPTMLVEQKAIEQRIRNAIYLQRTFRAGSSASRREQFVPLLDIDCTGQYVSLVVKIEYFGRLGPASCMTLAFGSVHYDAHTVLHVFPPLNYQDQSRIRFSIPNTWPP